MFFYYLIVILIECIIIIVVVFIITVSPKYLSASENACFKLSNFICYISWN